MGTQISIFDGANKFVNDKPIRLIECFAGYGSQALALKYLGIPFEHHRIAEWAVKSIQAYKDMHFPDDNTDYSCGMSYDNVIDYLFERGISADYNKPMTREQIKRMGENKSRTVYNNIKATHNLVSVCNVTSKDLDITDTDKFTYLLTYLLVPLSRFIYWRASKRYGKWKWNTKQFVVGDRKNTERV